MRELKMSRVFTLIKPGPVVFVTTCDGNQNNVMTISWTMVLDFTPAFAITTGEWNYAFALTKHQGVRDRHSHGRPPGLSGSGRVQAPIPTSSRSSSSRPCPASLSTPLLIKECLANIECKVVDLIGKHNIVVLEAVAAYENPRVRRSAWVHAVGDGTFIVDGRRLDRRKKMASKLPAGL